MSPAHNELHSQRCRSISCFSLMFRSRLLKSWLLTAWLNCWVLGCWEPGCWCDCEGFIVFVAACCCLMALNMSRDQDCFAASAEPFTCYRNVTLLSWLWNLISVWFWLGQASAKTLPLLPRDTIGLLIFTISLLAHVAHMHSYHCLICNSIRQWQLRVLFSLLNSRWWDGRHLILDTGVWAQTLYPCVCVKGWAIAVPV